MIGFLSNALKTANSGLGVAKEVARPSVTYGLARAKLMKANTLFRFGQSTPFGKLLSIAGDLHNGGLGASKAVYHGLDAAKKADLHKVGLGIAGATGVVALTKD